MRGALLTAALVVFAGCPPALRDPPPGAHTSVEPVLTLARDYVSSGPAAVVIEARATQYSDQGGLKGKLLILALRPGRLRMEGLSPTDDSVSILATDGDRFSSYQRGEKHCYVGRACPENVGRFASVPLEADDLVGVLSGRPPIIPHDRAEMKWDGRVGAYRLELVGSAVDLASAHGKVQRLWVAHGDGRIVRTSLAVGGRTKVDVRYSQFERVDGELMPRRLDVALSRESTDLRLDYRDIDLATTPPEAAFVFECPGGTELAELPCMDAP